MIKRRSLDVPIRGFVERCPRQDYSDSSIVPDTSPVADLLAEYHWLLDRDGNWRRPQEVTLDDLDPSYQTDEDLARRLEMRPTVSREMADLLQIDGDLLDLLRRRPELQQRILAEVSAAGKRSPKVIANALSAGFHRIIHRALPTPVGSRERVTR